MPAKIFCIGLNKTGTSSLHAAFEMLGLKSVHWKDDKDNNIKEIIYRNYKDKKNILKGIKKYDAYSDWNLNDSSCEIFKEFDKQYPGSKFILNTRAMKDWLDSREKHVRRNQKIKKRFPRAPIGWLKINRKKWKAHYKNHYAEVQRYFKGREEDLLVFDVTAGDGWEKLCPFLGLPIPDCPFPKKNIAPVE